MGQELKGDLRPLTRVDVNIAEDPNRIIRPILPTGEEPEDVDTSQFYVPTDQLLRCASAKAEVATLLAQLDSASWAAACFGLTSARRLAAHHPADLNEVLEAVLPRLRNHINNLRSSLGKTALLCAADFFTVFGDGMFAHLHAGSPSLLGSLLHKAALDKPFVIKEAKRTLATMVQHISSESLLHLLLSHVSDPNPKVRAVVANCVADTVDKALAEQEPGVTCCVEIEFEELLRAAAIFVHDRQPVARESARKLVTQLRETHARSHGAAGDGDGDGWVQFVEKILGKPVASKICKLGL
mmetsp:Transcript_6760/g.10395  ORF Transcript_6760/g.10395 Transcript_6760/m.10395 type:complete len:298 (-) Transcript_6760:1002-1895(-)